MMLRCCFIIWWRVAAVVVSAIISHLGGVRSFLLLPSQLAGGKQKKNYNRSHFHEWSTAATATPIREEIRYIAGRRALLLHPTTSSSPKQSRSNVVSNNPPLVVLGGMAQSIASWELHLTYFAKDRSVLIYECLGQGPHPPEEIYPALDLNTYYEDVSLKRQGSDFWNVVDEAFFTPGSYYHDNVLLHNGGDPPIPQKIDVVGFSFGGRVAMAAAVSFPNRIRRLHLTGVGSERDEYANVILASWKEMLGTNDAVINENNSALRAFAWSIILATYSEKFLASVGSIRVQTWVDGICQFNTQKGLRAILMQTHGGEGQWTPASMAAQMRVSVESCKLVVGSEDKMASKDQVFLLGQQLREDVDEDYFKVIENCGHAVPFEAMQLWRRDVIKFLT